MRQSLPNSPWCPSVHGLGSPTRPLASLCTISGAASARGHNVSAVHTQASKLLRIGHLERRRGGFRISFGSATENNPPAPRARQCVGTPPSRRRYSGLAAHQSLQLKAISAAGCPARAGDLCGYLRREGVRQTATRIAAETVLRCALLKQQRQSVTMTGLSSGNSASFRALPDCAEVSQKKSCCIKPHAIAPTWERLIGR